MDEKLFIWLWIRCPWSTERRHFEGEILYFIFFFMSRNRTTKIASYHLHTGQDLLRRNCLIFKIQLYLHYLQY